MSICDNLKQIRENIALAAEKSGRTEKDVKFVCVSKSVGEAEVREAFRCGQRDFAENRVQKLMEKQEALRDLEQEIRWHLIGQLQTNKVKYCLGKVCLIHSVDRIGLAQAISDYAGKHGLRAEGLLEVNISGEESKTGMPADQVDGFLEEFAKLPNLTLRGIMTMAPLDADEKMLRRVFSGARELGEQIARRKLANAPMGELSMGMSGDYRIAIEEGATIVRVGTACFREE